MEGLNETDAAHDDGGDEDARAEQGSEGQARVAVFGVANGRDGTEDVRGAVAERQKGHAGDVLRQFHAVGDCAERRTEAVGWFVTISGGS